MTLPPGTFFGAIVMLAALLFALAVAGASSPVADPPWAAPIDQPAFCRDLTAMIAASAETPTPFASVTRPGDERKGQWSPTTGVDAFGWCHIARYGEKDGARIGLRCQRISRDELAKTRAETAQAVRDCTGVEPLPSAADPREWRRQTVFETTAWTIHVVEIGCDRCRGMPSVELRLEPR